jgi:hypothetical protein
MEGRHKYITGIDQLLLYFEKKFGKRYNQLNLPNLSP